MKLFLSVLFVFVVLSSCKPVEDNDKAVPEKVPFVWEGANIYFLLVDRFNNADKNNDLNFNRTEEPAKLRGFMGGDIKGVTQKIKEGYFTNLGINAIWMTPIVEQIHGGTDEGTGLSYGFHGYWAKDWSNLDPNFGTKEDLKELVDTAHKKGIRVLLDAVVNHTGPVTKTDAAWPEAWVRTEPKCDYSSYENTVTCTLVENLPDIRTESNDNVELPIQLVEKWKQEGRYEQELQELERFFNRTGYPKAPRFYIIKWLTDYITEFGVDGYRVDTVKHTEPYVWQEFKKECDYAFAEYKKNNPDKVLDANGFYLVGEVYNYGISAKRAFNFGNKSVNYFDDSFNSLINFEAKWDAAKWPIQELFSKYSEILQTDLKGYGVLNYLSSHDDGQPFDALREKPFEAGTKLLLCPGASQVYYGDESARLLVDPQAEGDAKLRSFMNWADIENKEYNQQVLEHWQKLGRFRVNHPAVGAGIHKELSKEPYVFSRTFKSPDFSETVVVALGNSVGTESIPVAGIFNDGDVIFDAYSGKKVNVAQGKVLVNSKFDLLLLSRSVPFNE
ncbi:alpha-amylase family glycosyl hydrolase [Cognatitamlana onchidii]|uniref:alpha-amylase family glycosyl hydrolase n=1 Tax=Cognatitamlana onchidii TaxID=2562860 RepID=UPI0010A5DA50|nr:alpha-amylase family glycosyl hydrolase [Algibacter onchidii]